MDCFAMTTVHNRRLSFLRAPAILFMAALALGRTPASGAESYMTVGGVSVDVTAKNAAAARDQAIATVQRKAFDKLIKRLVPGSADQARLNPSQADIESFVQDFAIDNERTSAVRYIGLYTVRFRASRIHKYLADSGVASVGDLQQVLVVPVYRTSAGHLLWEQGNAWRTAWDRGGFGEGPVTLILPNADTFDTGALSAAAAENGNAASLDAMIGRYHAAGIAVVTAEARDPMHGPVSGLTVDMALYDPRGKKGSQTLTLDPVAGEQPEKTLMRGAAAAAAALEANWSQTVASTGSTGLSASAAALASPETQDQAANGSGTVYSIMMPLTGIGEWVALRDRLGTIPGVQLLSLDALTREGAALTLDFAGDPLALQAAIAGSGYVLAQTAPDNAAGPGSFTLRRAATKGQ
jgi:hypothetical protein